MHEWPEMNKYKAFLVGLCLASFQMAQAQLFIASRPITEKRAEAAEVKLQEVKKEVDNSATAKAELKRKVKEEQSQLDPYEKFNRVMFSFNEFLDRYFLKPVATIYNKLMPEPLNKGLDNFFDNLNKVPTIFNDVLQGNFYQTTSDSWRLLINTTLGVGGFFDMATRMGLENNSQDFGLTMAKWGYTSSDYLVLPFFGPRTVRDTVALPVNIYTSPYLLIPDVAIRNTTYAVQVIDDRARLLRFENVYEQIAIDKYIFIRTAYLQARQYEIERTKKLNDPYTPEDMQKMQNDYYLDE
ncbi:MAG: VacJ family lipoprotein [Pseudomonadota bacterium]|nr:VacJ family lipoprotein [Gammaproteobacteria bacterium]MBU1558650.1 VacJ family lipoprotein [Gammaproteobacteria bacterium]MBU1926836.1 VacJ family lipoprotein [Gammaproteobacteria bacterium]MBU2546167.1 VacJ family lipoprotein [Gammaproteobacteria bacterium]